MAVPNFRFALISDVQYADLPDGQSFHGVPRFYRHALVALKRAVKHMAEENVDVALHMGDIIDFHNSLHDGHSEKALKDVLDCFETLEVPTLHMIGNHCLYNAPRHVLNQALGIDTHKGHDAGNHSYYTYSPCPGWRFIVLDGYDISLLGWPEGHPLHEAAVEILDKNNPNENKNSNNGLEGLARRFVKFGGGMSQAQLEWLKEQLAACRELDERVIVCSHLAFHPETVVPTCLSWNYGEVLDVLQENADVVVATLAGHAHKDGYHQDEFGIHHRVCKAVLETEPGRDCYGICSVYDDRIEVRGVDTFDSGVWKFKNNGSTEQYGVDDVEKEQQEAEEVKEAPKVALQVKVEA